MRSRSTEYQRPPPLFLEGNRLGDLPSRGWRVVMSDAEHNQSAAGAACTIDAAHRRDHHHGDNGACRPHLIEVVHLGRRAVAVCHDCRRDSGFLSRARGRPPGVRPPPRNRRGRVLHLLFMGGVSRRPNCDQPHRRESAKPLQLFSASWLTPGSARTCPVVDSCYRLGSGTASRSSCRGCPVDRPGRDRSPLDDRTSTRPPAARRAH